MLTIDLKKTCLNCQAAELKLEHNTIYGYNNVGANYYSLTCEKADVCKHIDGAVPVEAAELLEG